MVNPDVPHYGDHTNIMPELDALNDGLLQQWIDQVWGSSAAPLQDVPNFPTIDALHPTDTRNLIADLARLDCYNLPNVSTTAFSTLCSFKIRPTVSSEVDIRQADASEHIAEQEPLITAHQDLAHIIATTNWLTIEADHHESECARPSPFEIELRYTEGLGEHVCTVKSRGSRYVVVV